MQLQYNLYLIMKAKEFKTHCTNSVLEYECNGIYSFYDLTTDFWFNYNINTCEFTEKGAIKISENQLLFIEKLIIDFHDSKENEKHQEQIRIYLMEDPL